MKRCEMTSGGVVPAAPLRIAALPVLYDALLAVLVVHKTILPPGAQIPR